MKMLCIAALAGLSFASPALALDLVPWGTSGAYAILTDPNHGNNCLAEGTFSDGSILRMGFQDDGKLGFLATFNPAWKEFKAERKYPVSYTLDGDSFDGEAIGKEINGIPGAQVHFDTIDLLVDLAMKKDLTFFYNGAEVVTLDLTGTKDAIKQVIACQAERG
jgi:hypothetical protein